MRYQFTPDDFTPAITARFLNLVQPGPTDWLWTGCVNARGYGTFWVSGQMRRTNRYMAALIFGHETVNATPEIGHTCNNPRCVRPAHLYLTDHDSNMSYARALGRMPHFERGEQHRRARLTDADVIDILSRDLSPRGAKSALAREKSVARCAIYDVLQGRGWKHVPRS